MRTFTKNERFRIHGIRERDPEQIFEVISFTEGWVNCRTRREGKSDRRYGFSADYLSKGVIEMLPGLATETITEVSRRSMFRHAGRMADQLLANTPVGEEIVFENAAQEIRVEPVSKGQKTMAPGIETVARKKRLGSSLRKLRIDNSAA